MTVTTSPNGVITTPVSSMALKFGCAVTVSSIEITCLSSFIYTQNHTSPESPPKLLIRPFPEGGLFKFVRGHVLNLKHILIFSTFSVPYCSNVLSDYFIITDDSSIWLYVLLTPFLLEKLHTPPFRATQKF